MPRWLSALGSLRLVDLEVGRRELARVQLVREDPSGQVHARPGHRQAQARPAHPAHGLGPRQLRLDAGGRGLELRVRLLGERAAPRPTSAGRPQSAPGRPQPGAAATPRPRMTRSCLHLYSSHPTPPGLARCRRSPAGRDQAVADRVADPQHGRVGDAVEDPRPVPAGRHEAGVGQAREVLRDVGLGAAVASASSPTLRSPRCSAESSARRPSSDSALKRAATRGISSASIIDRPSLSYVHANICIFAWTVKARE